MASTTAQHHFISLMIEESVLKFGDFTLKSGRSSPYFFNLGHIDSARSIKALGEAYAETIVEQAIEFDILFGPAYKGIPITVATAIALNDRFGIDCGIAFNRKEAKKHGEGGNLIGHTLEGRVLILDDVITQGTAIREVLELLAPTPATLAGIVVALDRQELTTEGVTALQSMSSTHGINVHSIAKLQHVIAYLEHLGEDERMLEQIRAHFSRFCVQ